MLFFILFWLGCLPPFMTAFQGSSNWESLPSLQIPSYPNMDHVRQIQTQIRQHPPLVFAGEIRTLKQQLSEVHDGKSFIFQGGPCAEEFGGGEMRGLSWTDEIRNLFTTMVQCSLLLSYGMEKKIIRIGRMAGQYAKPRSEMVENDGTTLTYRGDIIHGKEITNRDPDPRRMFQAYQESVCTLNVLRSLSKSGDLDLNRLDQWLDPFVHEIGYYQHMDFDRLFRKWFVFLENCGLPLSSFREPEFFISHEALLLYYEDALTRTETSTQKVYNCGAHTVWLGERTRHSEAHLRYLSTIENPIGIKVGPHSDPNEIRNIVRRLNPQKEKGKIMIITRMGPDKISHQLPPLFQALKQEPVLFMSDPCHANTIMMDGKKTRLCSTIQEELLQFFFCCHEHQKIPAGVHIEMSGDLVTECIGQNVTASSLHTKYLTTVDPRMNRYQSLELAFFISSLSNKIAPTIRSF